MDAALMDDDVPEEVAAEAAAALATEPEADRVLFLDRVRRHWPDLRRGLERAYGERAAEVAAEAVRTATKRFAGRPADLRLLDLRRLTTPDWFQQPRMLGYATYADRFGRTLRGVGEHVDHLADLGVTYLHLLPLLQPRPRPNDGGYAVQDYRAVRADLGTMDDLEELARTLRGRGISLTLDLVLNHVAREHEWAVRARAGEQRYRGYFHVFPDRAGPDAYEATLPEVFPDFAPGNFTADEELGGWVWTTFNDYQWDLNWHEPAVFGEFADIVLDLANRGVECLRLDAIAFIWKRLGTNCQNQPEVHGLTQALRAVARIAAPGLLFKAEAIVGPDDLAPYLGVGEHAGKVSDLAYHNGFMVQLWSSLAAGDARLARHALGRVPQPPPTTSWGTYIRCHDDIGWAIDDGDAAAVGWNGFEHRRFLSDYYRGAFPLSDARGLVFQENPATGDRRISGSAASLAGLEAALEAGDEDRVELALRRLRLLHVAILGHGGLPLIWMGDELGLRNDRYWSGDPEHADDNRWAHRPVMPWDVAARRHEPGTLEHRVWQELRHAIAVRAQLPGMHAAVPTQLLDPVEHRVLGWHRPHPVRPVVALHNVSAEPVRWPLWALPFGGGREGGVRDVLSGHPAAPDGRAVDLPGYGAVWLVPVP